MQGYARLLGRRHARPRPGLDGDEVRRGTGEISTIKPFKCVFKLLLFFFF